MYPAISGLVMTDPDKKGYPHNIFSYFFMKTYVMGAHLKCLDEALQTSTQNICFHKEIRKISVLFGCKMSLIWSFDIMTTFSCCNQFKYKYIKNLPILCKQLSC